MTKKNNETQKTEQPLAKREPTNLPIARGGSVASLFGVTPFNFMRRFTDDMERMFEDFNNFRLTPFFERELALPQTRWAEFQTAMWSPKIEVLETGGQFTVRAELPGLKKEDINVELAGDALTLSGERKEESKEEREGYYRSERSYGSFYRRIPLPEGANTEKAQATFQNGMLEVTLEVPARQLKGRKLEITEAGEKPKAVSAPG